MLGSEHFGYFGKYRRAALFHDFIGKFPHKRVSRKPRKTVASAAFKPYAKFAYRYVLAFKFARLFAEAFEYFKSVFYLVVHVLTVEIGYIISAERLEIFLYPVKPVVLAAKPHEQHKTRVRVERNAAKQLFYILVILAELGASELMIKREKSVYSTFN